MFNIKYKFFNSKNNKIVLCIFVILMISAICFMCVNKQKKQVVECINEEDEYYVGGEIVGIKLLASGVIVMGVDREDELVKVGDVILSANSQKVETDAELENIVQNGETISLEIQRNNDILFVDVEPKYNENSKMYRLGLWVKDSSAGIGTVTFYEENNGYFAALGHAITETSLNYVLPITTGGITNTKIFSIKKGSPKTPGELKGSISSDTIGQIYLNTQNGIFGVIDNKSIYLNNEKIKILRKEDIKIGKAIIYATIDENGKKPYEIEIEKIYLGSQSNKNISIKITDEELLEKTGGIIQGMSGAPVIQDGKLVGAITHVFLDDPTRGYACFIENMLNDMSQI